ncbi:alpha/beta fold hydrolase [Halocatena halophila]|uniref:alpha/beta fold hydrolase n=1 Tax=Halocatena halophila TaxID=2814576 RepID=UPI002ED3D621
MAETTDSTSTDASLLDDARISSTYRDGDGVRLHVVAAGDPDGPLVVLLHGYPDFWYGWHNQLRSLVDAGYRVLVPDQRGYNLSEAPEGIDAYRLSNLEADVRALIESEGRHSAHVVGHDFGAYVAWHLALREPDSVDRLAIFNVPHPTVYHAFIRRSPRQLARSWYAIFYQLPRFPEWLLGRNDAALLVSALEKSANPGTFDDEAIRRYRAAWRQNGVTPMINWYRGLRRSKRPASDTVSQPTLICWGENDIALCPELADRSVEYCTDGDLRTFPNASHWVHHERSAVTDTLLEHLSSGEV